MFFIKRERDSDWDILEFCLFTYKYAISFQNRVVNNQKNRAWNMLHFFKVFPVSVQYLVNTNLIENYWAYTLSNLK